MSKKEGLAKLIELSPVLQRASQDTKTRKEREERLKRAEEDFTFFCSYYLSDYFFCEPAEYQKILYDVIQTRELTTLQSSRLKALVPEDFRETFKPMKDITGIVDVEPREHGKSTRMTFAFPLWQILFKKSMFVLIVGASKEDAQLQAEKMKTTIEENEKIIEDFGFLESTPWNKGFFRLSNGAAVTTKGKGGSMRGIINKQHRPDLIIVDDTLKDEEADSVAMRNKVSSWFNRTVQPLGSNSLIVIVNTIVNEDDLPSRLLKDIKEEKKIGWLGLRFSAEVSEGVTLWPERYSWQDLKKKQQNFGSIAYAQEFLSRPLSDEDRLFKSSWIRRVKKENVPQKLIMFEGIDPATGAHDMSAVVDIGLDTESGLIYVISSHGQTESTETFKQRLFQRFRLFNYRRAGMEAVAFQAVFKNEIIRDAAKQGLHLPIKGIQTGRASKAVRLMALSPLIENGTIVFSEGNEMLIDQLVGFPSAGFDDLPDALYLAVKISGAFKGMPGELDSLSGEKLKKLRKELRF